MDERKRQDIQDQEFERYGVWVKAGPEEVIDVDETDDSFSMSDLPDSDLPEPDVAPEPDFGSPGNLDLDDDELVSLDDLGFDEPDNDTDPFATLADSAEEEEHAETDDFDLDGLNESLDEEYEDLDIDGETESADTSFDVTMPGSDDEIEDINLEDIEDFDGSEDLPELDSEIDDLEAPTPLRANTISSEEEEFLLEDTDAADQPPDLQNSNESAIPSTMDVQEKEAFERIQSELSDIKRELAELKAVLNRPAPSYRSEPTPADTGSTDTGPGIEADSDYQFEPEEPASDASTPLPAGSGFFEEEDDETIALTGDELDNILNTAEFTEEAGEAEELDDDFLGDGETPSGEPVSEIEMEEADDAPFMIDGDDTAVDELADMNIDEELAGIDSLADDTEADEDELDEIELDLDSLDELDAEDIGDFEDSEESDDAFGHPVDDGQAASDPAAEQPTGTETFDDDDLDDLDFDATPEPSDEPELDEPELDEPELDEPELDELELDDFELDEDDSEIESDEPADDTTTTTEPTDGDIEIQDEDESVEPTVEDSLDDLDIDDLSVSDMDLEEGGDDDGFEDFATAVENDINQGETGQAPEDVATTDDEETSVDVPQRRSSIADLPDDLKQEIRSVLSYMDQLLEALPDDKIEEFAQSEHFEVYKNLFEELGLET